MEIPSLKIDKRQSETVTMTAEGVTAELQRAAKKGNILTRKGDREKLRLQAETDQAKVYEDLYQMFEKSLATSTKIAGTLENKQSNASNSKAKKSNVNLSLFTGGTLRPYQEDGAAWLVKLREQGLNGILADEMGLGKTAQSISIICHMVATGASGPFIVLCPLSTVRNWENEFQRFSPSLPTIVFYGDKSERAKMVNRICIRHNLKNGSKKSIFPVVIAPFHMLTAEIRKLERIKWSYLIFDEASYIKNNTSLLYKCANSLCVKARLLLTGTPLQNNIRELFNLLHFCLPAIFPDFRLFEGWLEKLEAHREEGSLGDGDSCQLVNTMHTILAPFFLRRTKESVKIDLPEKKHIIVYCPLTKLQQIYYKAILDFQEKSPENEIFNDGERPLRTCRRKTDVNYSELSKRSRSEQFELPTAAKRSRTLASVESNVDTASDPGNSNDSDVFESSKDETSSEYDEFYQTDMRAAMGKTRFSRATMTNILMSLRRVVAHAWLVHFDKSWGNYYPRNREALLRRSGKLQVFDKLLSELLKRNHKILVFSQFVQVLDVVSMYLDLSGLEHFYLFGMTNLEERQASIDAFNKPDSVEKVFLLSTRAGGLGINLAGADTVIFFDTDWNPQMDLQAAARCHRIGQTRRVVIYRLIAKETIDERILDVATNKRRLEKVVMNCGKFDKVSTLKDLSRGDLLKVLRDVDWDAALDGDLLDPSRIQALADRDLVFKTTDDDLLI